MKLVRLSVVLRALEVEVKQMAGEANKSDGGILRLRFGARSVLF